MRKIIDLLEDYSLNSIREIFIKYPKELEKFGYKISPKSKFEDIQIFEKNHSQKYWGNFKREFILITKREILVIAKLTENSQKTKLFKENLIYEGRHHLRNVGNGEVEPIPSSQLAGLQNINWNLCKPEKSKIKMNNEMNDFKTKDFSRL